ncbi:hypothetical protein HPP92_026878 [Vanilla planifolia]|uniref:RING-type E3 ubiquitin transferase n=1 Tax=Vanilla planifolia TaxID=51239 RepID=A0A835V2F3_VANPL|nr:hypothetical protein HPP92_026878 [Vanilla planifolia]KAG0484899.1 hypothetical protein HPP92_008978 [Vanilla planifolia]
MDSPAPRPKNNIGDCTPQLCNVHCPHLCSLYLSEASPPPPAPRRHHSTATLWPEIIVITVTASASFFFLACFLVAFKFCGNHNSPASALTPPAAAAAPPSTGLDDSLVQQLPSFTHSHVDGPIGGEFDCAVCLHHFSDGDRLRRLPKCRHAFHQICVDTWLKSHSNCPICRAAVCTVNVPMEDQGAAAGEVVTVVDEVEETEGESWV